MTSHATPEVQGFVRPGFEAVREVFAETLRRRGELGAACCVYLHGEPVVDIWGGVRDRVTGAPWEADTMALVFSATKGLSAMALAIAHSRGYLDYDERVATYWPEFAQQGKERVTVRQLLGHQAALHGFDEPVDRELIADLDRFAVVLARQKPAWLPGTRQGYHAISLGFYQNELMRRVDPRGRSLGTFFQEEIADPLGIDFYIRLPESIPDSRLARLQLANPLSSIFHYPPRMVIAAMRRGSPLYRSLVANPGTLLALDAERVYARDFEVPSGGGVGTARAIARVYSVFAGDGREPGLRQQTLDALKAPAIPPAEGFRDACLNVEVQYSLGFTKPSDAYAFGPPSAFGAPGAGGSFGFADPEAGIGYGYVPNRMLHYLEDPRDRALRAALYRAVREHRAVLATVA